MAKEQPDYLSYLLRIWRVGSDQKPHGGDEQSRRVEKPIWRASLESVYTGERRNFASLDDLFDFLREQTGAPSVPRSDQDGGDPYALETIHATRNT